MVPVVHPPIQMPLVATSNAHERHQEEEITPRLDRIQSTRPSSMKKTPRGSDPEGVWVPSQARNASSIAP